MPEIIVSFVVLVSRYCWDHVFVHAELLRFSRIFLESSNFCFLSDKERKTDKAAIASALVSSLALSSPSAKRLRYVFASLGNLLSLAP